MGGGLSGFSFGSTGGAMPGGPQMVFMRRNGATSGTGGTGASAFGGGS